MIAVELPDAADALSPPPPQAAVDDWEFAVRTDTVIVGEIWRRLEQKLGHPSLFSSWQWTRTWLNHYGDLIPHRFLVAKVNGEPVGVCLVTEGAGQQEGPLPVRTRHIGTAGEPENDSVYIEYNRLMVDPAHRARFAAEIYNHIANDPDWDRFHFDGLTSDDADLLASQHPGFVIETVPSHFFDLRQAREAGTDVISRLGQSTRKNLRTNLRDYGSLETDWAEDEEQAECILTDLIRLHQDRWKASGKPGVFASKHFLSFHRDVIRQLLPLEQVVLFRVRKGEQVVGCLYSFVEQNRMLVYQCGSEPYSANKLSPGLVTDYLLMEEALRRGFDAYDLLAGTSQHKQKLSTSTNTLVWGTLQRPRFKFAVLDTLRDIKRRFGRPPR